MTDPSSADHPPLTPRSLTEPVPDQQAYACPRCGTAVTGAWYGPCAPCRDQLRASLGGKGRTVEAEAYVPKVNVTPNAVATKE